MTIDSRYVVVVPLLIELNIQLTFSLLLVLLMTDLYIMPFDTFINGYYQRFLFKEKFDILLQGTSL